MKKNEEQGKQSSPREKQVTAILINACFDECAEAVGNISRKANRESYGCLHGKCKGNFIRCYVVIKYA